MGKTYGYVRISSKDQKEDRQVIALKEFGVDAECIFMDKLSGKDFNRPSYKKLMDMLKEGDTLIIKSIDRLGRNYEEIIDQWRRITKEKDVAIVVIDMPLLDTRKKGQDLTGVFIADLVLQILSYVAQTEREMNHQRQKEGIAAAKAKGIRFGRPRKERPEQYERVKKEWLYSHLSARKAGELLGVHHNTFLTWIRSDEECPDKPGVQQLDRTVSG
ncbi:MAG: recombinase family protein [Eubacteriales bacterium]|nr:recombinase family protein [Eubacteriales bacterium]